MIGMGVLDSGFVSLSPSEPKWKNRDPNNEPISVLDTRRSPSPSTSASTLSGGGSSEVPPPLPGPSGEAHTGFLATAELDPIPAGMEVAGEDWEALLSDSGQEQLLLRWISNELIQSDTSPNEIDAIDAHPSFLAPMPQNLHPQIPNLCPQFSNFPIYSNETPDEKPQFPPNLQNLGSLGNFNFHPQVPRLNKHTPFAQTVPLQDPLLVSPLSLPPLKRPNLENSVSSGNLDSRPQFLELDKHPPETLPLVPQQVVYDQLFKASELILSGNLSNAHSILARLNHQLTPGTMPFQRASCYLKEALLQVSLLSPGSVSPNFLSKSPTPVDGLFKMGAYKLLSEVSPFIQFVNFTSNQAILEVLGNSERVHIVDFDIGSGAQWASFMTELPIGGKNRVAPCLKITAFSSPLTHHPFELRLMYENLTQFANEIGINFELEVVNLDAFNPNAYPVHLFKAHDTDTTLAVNFPIWAFSNRLVALPSLIRFIKQLSPKIVVSMERGGCERADLPFSYHLLHALQYYEALLNSIDAANMDLEMVSKIEKFIIQPQIDNIVLGRLSYRAQMPYWRALFAAAGFSQVNISDVAEIQADCVLKKTQGGGFHVERRQTSLVLSWQRCELVSASAWRC